VLSLVHAQRMQLCKSSEFGRVQLVLVRRRCEPGEGFAAPRPAVHVLDGAGRNALEPPTWAAPRSVSFCDLVVLGFCMRSTKLLV